MKAGIFAIGDELLLGQILNTNTYWISQRLTEAGIDVTRHLTVGDNREDIMQALDSGVGVLDLIIITGGLGPTEDDITAFALADYFGSPLVFREEYFNRLKRFFKDRNIPISASHRRQFMLPEAARTLPNGHGSAPGLWLEEKGTIVICTPGVPHEMHAMMETYILPELAGHPGRQEIHLKTFCTAGTGETIIADALADYEKGLPAGFKLAYMPGMREVRIRLSGYGTDAAHFKSLSDRLEQLLQPWTYGYDGDTLESVVGEILRKESLTLSTAESCTGGHLAHRITGIPGSSEYYLGSVIAYGNNIKSRILGVPEDDLRKFGAVSEQVAIAMAKGVRELMQTDYALSTTGIAGPGGATKGKPVGTVWIGIADKRGAYARRFLFGNQRIRNIESSSTEALNALRKVLTAPEF